MSQYLAQRITTRAIEYGVTTPHDVDFVGPVDLAPFIEPGFELVWWEGALNLAPPTPTAALRWDGTAPGWVEMGELTTMVAEALANSKADVNAVTSAAIGNLVNEYRQAAIDARAFEAAGFIGETTSYVSSYAQDNETNVEQTNEWAAKAIILRADAFEAAQESMRTRRFNFQRAMRNATTPAQLAHVVYLWDQFIAGLRAQLGLA